MRRNQPSSIPQQPPDPKQKPLSPHISPTLKLNPILSANLLHKNPDTRTLRHRLTNETIPHSLDVSLIDDLMETYVEAAEDACEDNVELSVGHTVRRGIRLVFTCYDEHHERKRERERERKLEAEHSRAQGKARNREREKTYLIPIQFLVPRLKGT